MIESKQETKIRKKLLKRTSGVQRDTWWALQGKRRHQNAEAPPPPPFLFPLVPPPFFQRLWQYTDGEKQKTEAPRRRGPKVNTDIN